MKKLQFLLLSLLVFTVLFSCRGDESISKNNFPNALADTRIVTRVEDGGIPTYIYNSTPSGKLENVVLQSGSTHFLSYNAANRVQTVEVDPTSSNRSTVTLTYDASGKIATSEKQTFMNNVLYSIEDAILTYTQGKLTNVLSKRKSSPTSPYSHYRQSDITYNGDNIALVKENGAMISAGIMQPMDPSFEFRYVYENHDSKINPLTTLPKEYMIALGLLGSMASSNISYNNVLKVSVFVGGNSTPVSSVSVPPLVYDAQNYPVSDTQNQLKFYYKTLQ